MSILTTFLRDSSEAVWQPKQGPAAHAIPVKRDDQPDRDVPLVVDLDGTLIKTDLLIESSFAHLGQNPLHIIGALSALCRGKAAFKAYFAKEVTIDIAGLPYDGNVLALIEEARAQGRHVFLASASNERYVSAIADHLGLFDGWFASSDTENLSAQVKANRLVAAFGAQGFDYIGNDAADLAVWKVARARVAVRAPATVRARLAAFAPNAIIVPPEKGRARAWIKLLRVHQWTKNALVLVPLLTAQRFDIVSCGKALAAALLFSLAASSIYILNDLVDIEADRAHPTKKKRSLAAGTVPVRDALIAALVLLAASLLGAFVTAPWFGVVLVGYIALTTSYTFVLKRKMMVDVITLAALYSIRVIGGAAAISVPVSEWLLAFSMFIFTALALIKRHTELAALLDANLPDLTNRNYLKSDLDIVAILAAVSAFNGITVFALYISSDTVHNLYKQPKLLWLICPILMYWIGRILIMSHRRLMHEDPVVFALKDRNSLLVGCLIGIILIGAITL